MSRYLILVAMVAASTFSCGGGGDTTSGSDTFVSDSSLGDNSVPDNTTFDTTDSFTDEAVNDASDSTDENSTGEEVMDPCEPYQWLVEDGKKWMCLKALESDIQLKLEAQDGICYFISKIFKKPATDFTFYPPDKFINHAPPPLGDITCILM